MGGAGVIIVGYRGTGGSTPLELTLGTPMISTGDPTFTDDSETLTRFIFLRDRRYETVQKIYREIRDVSTEAQKNIRDTI